MPSFSEKSKDRLKTCHPLLQDIGNEAIQIMDFSVTCGYRKKVDQMIAFQEGKSKAEWPNSKHNRTPSQAFDIDPYPIDYTDLGRYFMLAGIIKAIAFRKNIPIRWGGDFKELKDYAHYEIIV